MSTKTTTDPLRLPASLKGAAEEIFAMNTAMFFEERRARTNRAAFLRILKRKGGAPLVVGDRR